LSKTVAVSFEEDSVKIVHASLKGGSLSIEKTNTISEVQLESYLKNEKATNFVVTCEFKEAFHGTLNTPVVKPQYLVKIIESEIKKAINATSLSFIYTNLGERVIENKKVLEIFYYAVKSEEVKNIVGRFYECGKTVSALYPSVFSASAVLLEKSVNAGMGVYSTGQEKVSFFTKDGNIQFIRTYEALEPELTDFDIQNINMTISYCFQNIRISPSSIFLMGNLSEAPDVNTLPSAPLACLYKSGNIACENKIFMQYLLPIASYYVPKTSNILSREFRNLYLLKSYMSYATKTFDTVALLIIMFMVFQIKGIIDTKEAIAAALNSHHDLNPIYNEYSEKKERIQPFLPVISFINKPSADLRHLLVSLGGTDLEGLKLNTIEASTKDQTSYAVTLKGTGDTNTYASLQSSFDGFVNYLSNNRGINILSKTLDVSNKSIVIKFEYRQQR
jgi:hypothetical protein